MIVICLIAALSLNATRADDVIRLSRYRQTLEEFGVASDAKSANEFLISLFPTDVTRQEIESLIQALSSPTYQRRELAARQLVSKGPVALKQLIEAANNGDTETRFRSLRCIRSIETVHQRLVTAAIEVLKLDSADRPPPRDRLATIFRWLNETSQNRKQLIGAPKYFVDETCREEIQKWLQHDNEDIQVAAVQALPECHSESELKQFRSRLESRNPKVSLAAIKTIGFLEPEISTKRLIDYLSHRDKLVRQASISILRTVTTKYFRYRADGNNSVQRRAINKWKSWVATNAITPDHFKRIHSNESLSPTGFLVSVASSQVCQFDLAGELVWKQPAAIYDAQYINKDEVIIAERNRNLVRVINRDGETQLRIENVASPSDVEMLDNGNILVLSGNGRLYEFADEKLVTKFSGLESPFDADRLPNGDTIVADSGNNRIVIFDPQGKVIWEKNELQFPNNVHRLADGRILYTTYTSGDVVMLDSDGAELWRHNIPQSTLFSVYAAENQIFVADGSNSKIWVLGNDGKPIRNIELPVNFCDVDFITR